MILLKRKFIFPPLYSSILGVEDHCTQNGLTVYNIDDYEYNELVVASHGYFDDQCYGENLNCGFQVYTERSGYRIQIYELYQNVFVSSFISLMHSIHEKISL